MKDILKLEQTIKNVAFSNIDENFKEYITNLNKNFDLYLINIDFIFSFL